MSGWAFVDGMHVSAAHIDVDLDTGLSADVIIVGELIDIQTERDRL